MQDFARAREVAEVAKPERLEGRNGQVWRAYILGSTQEQIAAEHGVSRQRVGQILEEIRASIPAADRADAALVDLERLDALLSGVMPAAIAGEVQATRAALAVLERRAKMLRLDLDEPLRISFGKHLDDQGQLLADALGAVLDALDLDHEQRVYALGVAQAALVGEDPPAAPESVGSVVEEHGLMRDFRQFAEENGLDPDDEGGDEGDDDER